jgi:ABC-type Fe3+ transport system substrate-binding protein
MGKEWTLDYARKIPAQEPVWARGQSRAISSITAGEYALHHMVNYHSTVRAMKKDPTGSLQFKVVEPVPARLTLAEGVYQRARHPYAALLFLEYVASPEGQAILDEYSPLASSIYSPGSHNEKLIKGRKVAVSTAEHFELQEEWRSQVVGAFGFPKATLK